MCASPYVYVEGGEYDDLRAKAFIVDWPKNSLLQEQSDPFLVTIFAVNDRHFLFSRLADQTFL